MLLQTPSKIMLALAPIDMRKSYQGLGVLVQNVLNQDPFSSIAFVFLNKKQDRLKILYWHINGFCILQKRLEKGRFLSAKGSNDASLDLSMYQLQGLIQGTDWQNAPEPKQLSYKYI
jgi:transposase